MGGGRLAVKIAKVARFVQGIDISSSAIREAQELAKKENVDNVKFKVAIFETFETKQKFDLIYMTEVIEHIYDAEAKVSKLSSWLDSNGLIVITTPNANNVVHKFRKMTNSRFLMLPEEEHPEHDPGHVNYFTPEEMRKILESCGLQILKAKEFPRIWKEHMFVIARKA